MCTPTSMLRCFRQCNLMIIRNKHCLICFFFDAPKIALLLRLGITDTNQPCGPHGNDIFTGHSGQRPITPFVFLCKMKFSKIFKRGIVIIAKLALTEDFYKRKISTSLAKLFYNTHTTIKAYTTKLLKIPSTSTSINAQRLHNIAGIVEMSQDHFWWIARSVQLALSLKMI